MPATEEYLTYEQVAEEMTRLIGTRCTAEWVRWLAKSGRLPVVKFSRKRHRITRTALTNYLNTVHHKQEGHRGQEQTEERQE